MGRIGRALHGALFDLAQIVTNDTHVIRTRRSQDQTQTNMTLNTTYAIALSFYALFAWTATLTVFSLIPAPTEASPQFKLARRVWIGLVTVVLCMIPGVMQHMLSAHPGYYSTIVILILFRLFRKGDSLKATWSLTLLVSTLIISNCLQRYESEILEHVRHAIAQPNFLGL